MREGRLWRWLAATVVALAAGGLAGRGSDGEGGSGRGAEAEEGAFPVPVRHRHGTTGIAAAPERVVTPASATSTRSSPSA